MRPGRSLSPTRLLVCSLLCLPGRLAGALETPADGALKVRWRHPVEEVSHVWWVHGGPGGQPVLLYSESRRARLVALDPSSGEERWSLPQEARPVAGALVAGQWVFLDKSNVLRELRLDDGGSVWRKPLSGARRGKPEGAYLAGLPGTDDFLLVEPNRLSRRSAEDGSAAWSVSLPWAARAGIVVRGDRVLLAAGRSLVSYRLDDGRAVWGQDLAAAYWAVVPESSPAAFVATETDRLVCINLEDGRRLWEQQASVALSRDLPAPENLEPGTLLYLDSSRWTDSSRRDRGRGAGAPLRVLEGKVYLRTSTYSLKAFDGGNGRPLWSLPLRAAAALYQPGDCLCLASRRQPLVCMDPGSGETRWESDFEAGDVASVSENLLASWDRRELRLIDACRGEVLGRAALAEPARSILAPAGASLLIVETDSALIAMEWNAPDPTPPR